MVTYCFVTDDGETTERHYSSIPKNPPKRVKIGNKWAHRDFSREQGGVSGGKACWPRKSLALGCSPDEVKEYEKWERELGVPTRHCPDTGDAIIESRDHQNRLMKARGLRNWDAGYGDYSGRH